MPRLTEQLLQGLNSLDAQSFRPGDSTILSTINHPLDAVKKFGQFLSKQTNTAAGIPDQYDNPYPLLAPSPDAQSQAAFDVAGMAQVGAFPFAPKGGNGTLGSITTYHGSPHKFDKFSMDKIGTGEGAQAYGHGLYFAESPEVAEGYKRALSGGTYVDKRGMPVQPNEVAADIYEAARKGGADVDEASDASSFWSLYLRDGDKMSNSPGFKYIKEVVDGRGITFKEKGNLYKTSLEWPDPAREAADPLGPHHFLDWDKPLSEQPESVKSAWSNLFGDVPQPQGPMGRTLKGLMAEDDLKAQGIPGIRYLDGGSRGAGEGSYNYVLFDDQIPKIVERNGQPVSAFVQALSNPDNLNESLLQKYLQQGSLKPDELAQYERNAIAMRDSNRQFLNVANADAQGGTAMDRARDMGFDTPAYHATQSDLRNITPSIDGYMGEGIYLSDDAKEAAFFGARKGVEGLNILPVKIKGNITKWDGDDYRHQSAQNADIRKSGYDGAFKNFNDINTEFNIFKPENIRSRFAAFDPLRKDSADLLATKLLTATMLGWGMANQQDSDPLTWALSQP